MSVVSIRGPPIPLGHTAGSVENNRGAAARDLEPLAEKPLLAEQPETEVAEEEQRQGHHRSQLAATSEKEKHEKSD